MFLWDIEWIDADSTPLEQQRHLDEEAARHQAQRWLKEDPGSRVYLYQRRGEISVLMETYPPRQGHADQADSRP